jgi:hypothetical protein
MPFTFGGGHGSVREKPQAGDEAADHQGAGRRLKRDGIEGWGIATLMAERG